MIWLCEPSSTIPVRKFSATSMENHMSDINLNKDYQWNLQNSYLKYIATLACVWSSTFWRLLNSNAGKAMKTGTSTTFSRSMTSVSMSQANRKFEYGCITKSPTASMRSFSDRIAFTEPNLFTSRLFTSQPASDARNDCLVFSLAWSNSLVLLFSIEPKFQLFLLFCFSSSELDEDSESLSPLDKKSVMCCDSLRMSSIPWMLLRFSMCDSRLKSGSRLLPSLSLFSLDEVI